MDSENTTEPRHRPAGCAVNLALAAFSPALVASIGELPDRIFYDVVEDAVEIIAVLPKSRAYEWLEEEGEATEGGTA